MLSKLSLIRTVRVSIISSLIHYCIFWLLDLFSSTIVLIYEIWYFVWPYLFCFLIMAIERDNSLQSVSVTLDGKNNLYWSYVMRNFLKCKNCGDMLLELV